MKKIWLVLLTLPLFLTGLLAAKSASAALCCLYTDSSFGDMSCTFWSIEQEQKLACKSVGGALMCAPPNAPNVNQTCPAVSALKGVENFFGAEYGSTLATCPAIPGKQAVPISNAAASDVCNKFKTLTPDKTAFGVAWLAAKQVFLKEELKVETYCQCYKPICAIQVPITFKYDKGDVVDKEAKYLLKSTEVCKAMKCDVLPNWDYDALTADKTLADVSSIQLCKSPIAAPQEDTGPNPNAGIAILKSQATELDLLKVTPAEFVGRVIKTVMGVIGTVALVMMIYGGLLWMISQGGERQSQALKTLFFGALGIIVILSSYALVSFLFEFL